MTSPSIRSSRGLRPSIVLPAALRMMGHRAQALIALAVVCLVVAAPQAASGQAGGNPPFVDGEILIAFRTPQAAGRSGAVRAANRATLIGQFARTGIQHWRLPPGLSVEQAVKVLGARPDVKYCEPNYWLQPTLTPSDPQFSQSWALENNGQTGGTVDADIDAPEAWDQSTGDSSVIVAVIDTGIDVQHPDLADNIWTNPAECPGGFGTCVANGVDEDGNGYVDDFHGWDFLNGDNSIYDDGFLIGDSEHGTHVTGTIAARGDNGVGMAGVNWHVNVIACKFIGLFGGPVSAAIEAIEYASANGARVINASWGGTGPSAALKDAIEMSGAVFVAAAGNDGTDNDALPMYPASFDSPNLIAVAATDHNDQLASFSNWGATSVDLAAPGAGIYSTMPNNTYGFLSGTSMAAPHVSGVAALVLSLSPDLTPDQVIARILDGVDPVSALAGQTVTGGRLNAAASLGPDTVGPFITATHPSGPASAPVDRIRIAFNEAMDASTFTPADVLSFVGPLGPIGVAGVDVIAGSGDREFDITFSTQTELGDYSVVIGSDITDANGNPMDQDRDGIGGQPIADQFASTFTVLPFVGRFDFGPDGSPVETGYAAVAPTHVYDATAGFGWLEGNVSSVDRFVGSKVIRDLDYGSDYVFAVDVPIATYTVTLTTGDTGIYPHDEMAVILEGAQVDTVSTLAGEVKTITYENVTVSDGQLTLRMTDLGGSTANAVINGLQVVWASADTTGPRVIDATPVGAVDTAIDHVTLTFNEPLTAGSFTVADVVSLTGPAGSIVPIAVTALSATQYDVVFDVQTAFGDYTLLVGPDIDDLSGNPMDQNANAINGEPVADRFVAMFRLVAFVGRFDFGTAVSPVAAGYIGVQATDTYDSIAGYGWQAGTVAGVDRPVGTPLGRDLNYGSDYTFAVDVPSGTYSVTLTTGDTGIYPHDEMAVLLDQVQVDIVGTLAGEVKTITYENVTISDGQLTVRMTDLGGSTGNAVINGLEVLWVSGDVVGPLVIDAAPAGTVAGSIDHIALIFDEPIAIGSFTLADVTSLTGPSGAISPTAVIQSSDTQFDVTFAEQADLGAYTLVVGPDILDLSGNAMAAPFSTNVSLAPMWFDFGVAGSAVSAGFLAVLPTDLYDATLGFGWQTDTVLGVDRPAGTNVGKDLNYGPDMTFAVDLPDDVYTVTLTIGDTGIYPHDEMAIFIEQTQVDTVNTAPGGVLTIIYNAIVVVDGQLALQIVDMGGSTSNAVINGLEIDFDRTGPRVVAAEPTGTIVGPIDFIALTFDEPVVPGSFTVDDIVSLTGPLGPITPLAVISTSDVQFEVTFAEQTAGGNYSLVIGPDIVDVAGNAMDQNANGVGGEPAGDQFETTVGVIEFLGRFDFGTAVSSVASGYMAVRSTDTYDPIAGSGWLAGTVADVDRPVGTPLGRDLNYGVDFTFGVDVPNGTYAITLTIGDTGIYPHDRMAVRLEQIQVDIVDTAPGEVKTIVYDGIAVVDGQLTVRITDLGGVTGNAVINGLDIVWVAP